MNVTEQDRFEEWAISKGLDIKPYVSNPKFQTEFDYEDIQTQMFWECWKAACEPVVYADGKKAT